MRRSIIYLIALVCIAGAAQAEFLGIKKTSERVTFRLKEPLDSAYGIERKPDSVHILIRCDTGTVASATPLDYKARSTTYPFADITNTPIDTTKDYGDTAYWFTGVLSNFGTTTMSQVTISVDLYTGKYYRTTDATYQVIADSLNYDLKQGRDSAGLAAKTVLSTGVVLATDAITAAKIATDAIGAAEIAADAIGASEVATDAIGASEIAADAVGASELAATAVNETWNHRIDTIAGDSTAGKVLYKAKVIKDTTSTQLNATITSRGTSTLTTSDNIGINWADVANPTTTLGLTGTTVGTATNISQIGGTAQSAGMNLATYLPAVFDTALFVQGFRVNAKTKLGVSANTDTLHVYWSTTELFKVIYYHIGGAAGDPPDSTKTVAP